MTAHTWDWNNACWVAEAPPPETHGEALPVDLRNAMDTYTARHGYHDHEGLAKWLQWQGYTGTTEAIAAYLAPPDRL
jgi:hypothetical protein